jgi:hypothetical protein
MKCKYKPNGQRRGATAAELEGACPVGSSKGVPSAAFTPADGIDTAIAGVNWGGDTPGSAERHRIFMDHPAVSLAYRAKVLDAKPGAQMSEAAFWGVYKQSSMAQRHVHGRKRAAAVATEADAMFAEFHAREQVALDAAERRRAAAVDTSINMDRFDDHRQVHVLDAHGGGEPPRGAKRRRGQSNAAEETRGLELMRKLNMHGAMVLDGVSNQSSSAWREDDEERAHPLRHLEDRPAPVYAQLALEDERAFLAAQSGSGRAGRPVDAATGHRGAVHSGGSAADLQAAAQCMAGGMAHWAPPLSRYDGGKAENGAALDALLAMMKP